MHDDSFPIPRKFFLLMKPAHASVLAYLINYYPSDDWFECLNRDLQQAFGLNEQPLSHIIRALKKMGFLRSRMVGLPARRWLKINHEAIEKAMRKVK